MSAVGDPRTNAELGIPNYVTASMVEVDGELVLHLTSKDVPDVVRVHQGGDADAWTSYDLTER